jgi:hypothetical protein
VTGSDSNERALCVLAEHDEPCKNPRWSGRLCSDHQGRLTRGIRSIPEHATTILALLGHTTANGDVKVSGSKDQPLPAASVLALIGPEADHTADIERAAENAADQTDPTVLAQLGSWAILVQDELELAHETYPSSLAGLEMACQALTRNLAWMVGQDWITDCYAEITTLAHNVRTAAGDSPQPQHGKVPCPVCGMRALFSAEPREPYTCSKRAGGCGTMLAEADHDLLVEHVGTAFIERDQQESDPAASIEALHEAVASHWRDSSPRHTPGTDEERDVRAFGADVRPGDYDRAESVWASKGKPRNNRTRDADGRMSA